MVAVAGVQTDDPPEQVTQLPENLPIITVAVAAVQTDDLTTIAPTQPRQEATEKPVNVPEATPPNAVPEAGEPVSVQMT